MDSLKKSELVLQPDGRIYHLNLHEDEIADTILLVGDPGRVADVSRFFSKVEITRQNREIITHTGYYNNKRISVLSTGMGTDNIDIVVTELDALANIDLKRRELRNNHKSLNLIRLGTCGGLQKELDVDSFIASSHAIGLDGLMHFYEFKQSILCQKISDRFIEHTNWSPYLPQPYTVEADAQLLGLFSKDMPHGITATAPGFYGPQGREIRLKNAFPNLNQDIESFSFEGLKIMNFEMETSALYGLSSALGHKACTICTIVANRVNKTFSQDYHPAVNRMIELTLNRITQ